MMHLESRIVIVMKEHARLGRRPRGPNREAAVRYGCRKMLHIFRWDVEDANPYNRFFPLSWCVNT